MMCATTDNDQIWPPPPVHWRFLQEANAFGVAILALGGPALEEQKKSESVNRKNQALLDLEDFALDSIENPRDKVHGVASAWISGPRGSTNSKRSARGWLGR